MSKSGRECKELMVKEVSRKLSGSKAIFFTAYKGLTSQDIVELRGRLRSITSNYLIIKNSIVKLALNTSERKEIENFMDGPLAIVHNGKDPCHLSKVLVEFSRTHEAFIIKGGILDNAILSKEDIFTLASLPSREVLLTKIAIGLNSPMVKLVSVLQANIRKFVSVLSVLKEKKEINLT